MPDILVFGCSYTQGFKPPIEESWSWQLRKRPQHLNFTDLSKGGSSVQFQYFLYNVVLQELNPDAVIFQLTTPFRISLWPEVFDWKKYTVKRSDNYTFFDNDLLEKDCVFASSAWLTTHGIFTGIWIQKTMINLFLMILNLIGLMLMFTLEVVNMRLDIYFIQDFIKNFYLI